MLHDFRRFALLLAVLGISCSPPNRRAPPRSADAGATVPEPTRAVPVIRKPTVVAFWLAAADTLEPALQADAREEFRRSNGMVAEYLSDTDVALVATVTDTIMIELESGIRRMVMLSGVDFPYGYVLVVPGYPEEFHTGIDADEDLQAAIDDFFGLETDTSGPRHRIAQGAPVQPGPRTTRPGLAPVWVPSRITSVPLTATYRIPTETWWGCSKVARSLTVSGSKTVRSA